ncbi:hypothetical protein SEMRO_370_G128400.1 [Seminavis robusta]|uniref:Uncharacterized protein n=1 Tax=Seminavis robusta TaxID=568900 RepID=A0A9N8DVB3_9STRA|nr:hypothetical protein SEMRO_370_G128400.1 [Seminavis robusta]|eukprot:Sro370_g128400.1 n/a (187) ;mRNA; f:17413-18103
MPKRRKNDDKVERAAMLLKLSKKGNQMNVNEAMRFAGYRDDDMGDQALKRAIYRARDDINTPKKQSAEPEAAAVTVAVATAPLALTDRSAVAVPPTFHAAPNPPTKMRLTSYQAHGKRKQEAGQKNLRKELFAKACNLWKEECEKKAAAKAEGKKYRGKSAEDICSEINAEYDLDTRIAARTRQRR